MYRLIIIAHGDNEELHRDALGDAMEAVKRVNHAPIYDAYLEKIEDGKIVSVPGWRTDVSDRNERQLAHATDTPHHLATKRIPPDLSGYRVTIRHGLFGWMWEAQRPDGTKLLPVLGINIFSTKEKAEQAAATAIARDADTYTVDGETLRNRTGS